MSGFLPKAETSDMELAVMRCGRREIFAARRKWSVTDFAAMSGNRAERGI